MYVWTCQVGAVILCQYSVTQVLKAFEVRKKNYLRRGQKFLENKLTKAKPNEQNFSQKVIQNNK